MTCDERDRYYVLGMTSTLQAVTVKIPLADLRRIPEANRSEFIRSAVSEKLAREPASEWKPKTATGRKLLALRAKFIRSGGELLDSDGIADERVASASVRRPQKSACLAERGVCGGESPGGQPSPFSLVQPVSAAGRACL